MIGLTAVRKATPGIMESWRPKALIDAAACYVDVGLSHPGRATAAKGGGVHPLKRYVSWVQNGASQFGLYLLEVFEQPTDVDSVHVYSLVPSERKGG